MSVSLSILFCLCVVLNCPCLLIFCSNLRNASASDYIPDACLIEIVQRVGNDWRRLASQLRISASDNQRHGTELAALRAWRDRHLERPLETTDLLRRALSTLRRTDLLKVLELYVRDARRDGSAREGPKLVSTV